MGKILLTQSILSSWKYQFDCFEGCEEQARTDFLNALNRIHTPETEAQAAGIAFENVVTGLINGQTKFDEKLDPGYLACAQKFADILKGAQLQVKAYRDYHHNGLPFLLYGKLDGLKAGVIYDIKFSSSYEVGKYADSYQHPIYFELVPEADGFVYLVSNGKHTWTERYFRDECQDIHRVIDAFISWLQVYGLYDLYLEKWGGD